MTRSGWMLLPVLTLSGCLLNESPAPLVPADPFSPPASGTPVRTQTATFAPAATQVAARVEAIGVKVLDANKQASLRLRFHTIGSPQPEIFHVQDRDLFVTEGLVNQCKTDGELAAVLCQEMGKIVTEREIRAGPKARNPEREPPPDLRIGTDYVGGLGSPDQTRLAELARFDKERSRAAAPLPPPDPRALAHGYLKRAGYAEGNLETVTPLLQAAALNSSFEKQLAVPAHP